LAPTLKRKSKRDIPQLTQKAVKRCHRMSAIPTPTPAPPESLFAMVLDNVPTIIFIIVVAIGAITIERLLNKHLSGFSKRVRLQPHTTNNIMLFSRIVILLIAIAIIAKIGGLPSEWILSLSAIGGAALGFASQKTIGNFIAGLFIIAVHPFKVGDYVRIGAVEGLVHEITLNYTKVFTSASSTVLVSNLQVLDRDITNFSVEMEKPGRTAGMYCYTFEIGFDHSVSTEKILKIFENVFKSYLTELPRKIDHAPIRLGVEQVYMIYLYVRKPEDIVKYRSLISEEIYKLWDIERALPKT
jgi:small-conductance mechanosensitive channel